MLAKKGLGLLVFIALASHTASAAPTVAAQYVKTLGQSSQDARFSLFDSGARIAVDEAGNAYFGTPAGSSYLQKVSSDGTILWQKFLNVPGFQATAVDDQYLYTGGSGHYGYRQLQRWSRETGEPAPGWQYEWKDATTPVDGVAPMGLPYAMAVDDKYLYVADLTGNEIRRFDKATGKDAPFKIRLLAVSPKDIAITPRGTLLILTESAVVEVDKEGAPLRVPVMADLRAPTALDVDKNGAIYLAEGGDDRELINRVRVYSADGKTLQKEIGIGGDFSGHWHSRSFAFSSGAGDVALDGKGGFWVNGYGARMSYCPILTHFKNDAPDLVLRGVAGNSLAVDSNLDVYVGGSYKIGWDGELKWTSGLVGAGPLNLFPTTISYWPMQPLWSDGQTAIIASAQQSLFYQVGAQTGAATGKTLDSGGVMGGYFVSGKDLFYTIGGRTIRRTTSDLAAPETFATLPESVTITSAYLAVSDDRKMVYLSDGGQTICYALDGAEIWKAKGRLGTLWKGVIFTSNPDGPGVVALDAKSGEKIAVLGDKEAAGQPLLYAGAMAMGSKDGADYLFMQGAARIFVYQVTIG